MWAKTNVNNNAFKNATRNRNITERLGKPSVHGAVWALGTDQRYVLKTMPLKTGTDLKIFKKEVAIGGRPGVEKFGPRIYASRIMQNERGPPQGQYIMDNFMKGNTNVVSYMMSDYLKSQCPTKDSQFYNKLKKVLVDFWKISGMYHGDLHLNNMVVIVEPVSGDIKRIMIFDYGAAKKIKANISKENCFRKIVETIHMEFMNSVKKPQSKKATSQNPYMLWHLANNNQPRRSNLSMLAATGLLNKLDPRTPINWANIMMTRIKGRTPQESRNRILSAVKTGGIRHNKLYMTPRNFNNAVNYIRAIK